MQAEAGEAGAEFETGKEELVEGDRREPAKRDLQCLVVEDRDAKQRQAEQDEIDRNAEHEHRLSG